MYIFNHTTRLFEQTFPPRWLHESRKPRSIEEIRLTNSVTMKLHVFARNLDEMSFFPSVCVGSFFSSASIDRFRPVLLFLRLL